eukprot:TRINITY_DN2972_c0_g1_i1.p1 TRINITY_DN2972_c0_g1~~TRINITY_DN2972_c0_g1_i1.p1  ORF type:complete len:239 (-),score=38.29 TRINITY_DN2972_c0_g1_i1:11-727(-)
MREGLTPSPQPVREEPKESLQSLPTDEDSQLVDHYRGTPPRTLGRSKMKNKKNRMSQDSVEHSKKTPSLSSSSPNPPSRNEEVVCLAYPESVPRWMPLHEHKSDESLPECNLHPQDIKKNFSSSSFLLNPESLKPIPTYSEVQKVHSSFEKSTQFPPMPKPRKRRQVYQEIKDPLFSNYAKVHPSFHETIRHSPLITPFQVGDQQTFGRPHGWINSHDDSLLLHYLIIIYSYCFYSKA